MDTPDSMGGMPVAGFSMPDAEDLMLGSNPDAFGRNNKTKRSPAKGPKTLTKAGSTAPKRFKSSFIFFSMEKHKEIKEHLALQGEILKTTNITKMVSDAWRNLGPAQRAKYDAMAREDKARYEVEKASYKEEKGAVTKKKQRDPDAPKRPMSAFLSFANSRRAEVKAQNPDCSNGEISKILSNMWKEAPEIMKQHYRDDEAALWASYKAGMVDWRKKNDGRKKASKALKASGGAKGAEEKAVAPKKKRKKKQKDGDEIPSVSETGEAGFDDHPLSSGIGVSHGFDIGGNPNHEEMMAASALRGVRGGPNYSLGQGTGMGMGGLNSAAAGFDGGMSQQNQFQQGGGGYGSLFGMNSMNGMNQYGGGVGQSSNAPGGGQDMGNNTNRALLEMGFPYQQYGGYNSMLMAQALRGGQTGSSYHNQLLGFSDQQQQPPLSQLASLAGNQNIGMHSPQSQLSGMGMGMGMGQMMNDNSNGSMNRMSLGDSSGGMHHY